MEHTAFAKDGLMMLIQHRFKSALSRLGVQDE